MGKFFAFSEIITEVFMDPIDEFTAYHLELLDGHRIVLNCYFSMG